MNWNKQKLIELLTVEKDENLYIKEGYNYDLHNHNIVKHSYLTIKFTNTNKLDFFLNGGRLLHAEDIPEAKNE